MTRKAVKHNGRVTTVEEVSSLLDPFGRAALLPDSLEHLVIIRQSAKKAMNTDADTENDELDLSQFGKMAKQICGSEKVARLPGADVIRNSAAELVRQTPAGADLRKALNAIPVPGIGGRISTGYLIVVDNTGWLLVVDSAAKAKVTTDDHLTTLSNPFTDAVCRLIDRYEIQYVYSRADRIIRTSAMAQQIASAGRRWDTVIHTNDYGSFNLGDTISTQQFLVLSQFIQMSYQATVKGLTNGWHSMLLDGRWPKSATQLPAIGYKLVSETDPLPVPDELQAAMVRDVIEWAADESVSYAEIASRLGKTYGWLSPVARSRSAQGTVEDLRYPTTAVRNLLASGLPLWLTGIYRYTADIPYWLSDAELLTPVAKRVARKEGSRDKFAAFEISFNHGGKADGKPVVYPGANRSKIEAAMRRLAKTSPSAKAALLDGFTETHSAVAQGILSGITPPVSNRGGKRATDRDRKPLAGLAEWVENGTQYAISARHRENYLLVSRPEKAGLAADGTRRGWHDDDRNIVAVLNPEETHRALAESVIATLETGVEWVRNASEDLPEAPDEAAFRRQNEFIEGLEAQARKAEAKLDVALETGARKKANELMGTVENLTGQLEEARLHLAKLHAASSNQRLLDARAVGQVENIVSTMALLASTTLSEERELNERLGLLFTSLTARVVKEGAKVEIQAHLRVATTDNDIIVGPITCEVLNRRRTAKTERGYSLFVAMFRDGLTLEQAAERYGYSDLRSAQRRIHEYIKRSGALPSKGLRAAAIDCPLPEVRRVVFELVESTVEKRAFQTPEGISPVYALHIADVYGGTAPWTVTWCSDSHAPARAALGALEAAGEKGIAWDTLLTEILPGAGIEANKTIVVELANGKNQDKVGSCDRVVAYDPLVERSTPWHGKADRRVWARRCPFCDERTLTHVLRVPEVPGGMLCSSCRRTPSLPRVFFPEGYLRPWAGPRGVGSGKTSRIRGGTKEA